MFRFVLYFRQKMAVTRRSCASFEVIYDTFNLLVNFDLFVINVINVIKINLKLSRILYLMINDQILFIYCWQR